MSLSNQNHEQSRQKLGTFLGNKVLSESKFEKKKIFKVLYLLKMCPISVGSVHNFGKSDDDII